MSNEKLVEEKTTEKKFEITGDAETGTQTQAEKQSDNSGGDKPASEESEKSE